MNKILNKFIKIQKIIQKLNTQYKIIMNDFLYRKSPKNKQSY